MPVEQHTPAAQLISEKCRHLDDLCEYNKKYKNGIIIQVPPDVISTKTFREPRVYSWNANLLTTFSIYVIVYEQSLGFTNIINHIYIWRLYAFQARDFPHTFNATYRNIRYSLLFYYILLPELMQKSCELLSRRSSELPRQLD